MTPVPEASMTNADSNESIVARPLYAPISLSELIGKMTILKINTKMTSDISKLLNIQN